MNAQGLLIKARDGQDFLLTTEPRTGMNTYRLAVLQRVDDTWKPLNGIEEPTFRESMIGAFVDFFVDICRVLNASSLAGLKKSGRTKRPITDRSRAHQPVLTKQGRSR